MSEEKEKAKEKFMTLRRLFLQYKEGKLSASAVLHFLAGYCGFCPNEDEEKLLMGLSD